MSPYDHYAFNIISELKLCSLDGLTHLTLRNFILTNIDEFIPCMPNLVELRIGGSQAGHQDGLLKVLQQLSHSNVTALDLGNTGLSKLLHDSPYHYSSALKALIHPSSGRLERLSIGDEYELHQSKLMDLVTAPSSLRSLTLLGYVNSLSGFINNANLHELKLTFLDDHYRSDLVEIVKHNRTLRDLTITLMYHYVVDISFTRTFVDVVCRNSTLHSITFLTSKAIFDDKFYEEGARDPRIKFVRGFVYLK